MYESLPTILQKMLYSLLHTTCLGRKTIKEFSPIGLKQQNSWAMSVASMITVPKNLESNLNIEHGFHPLLSFFLSFIDVFNELVHLMGGAYPYSVKLDKWLL